MSVLLRRIILSFLGLFGFICYAQNVHVSGYIKGLKRDSLMIMRYNNGIDIRYIKVKNERFEFTDQIKEPVYIQIMGQGKLDLLIEPGNIKLTGSAPFNNQITVSGSRSDSVMKAYLKEDDLLSDSWYKYKDNYDSLKKKNMPAETAAVKEKMNVTLYSRVALLKQYVGNFHTEIVGALLINFCMLKDVLTKADLKEMYTGLSPDIRKSAYGRSVLERLNTPTPKKGKAKITKR